MNKQQATHKAIRERSKSVKHYKSVDFGKESEKSAEPDGAVVNPALTVTKAYFGMEREFQNDIWNTRNLPAARIGPHQGHHTMSFLQVPEAFRPAVKRHMRVQVVSKSFYGCHCRLRHVRYFVEFFQLHHPQAETFRDLKRRDIEDYLIYLSAMRKNDGTPQTSEFRYKSLAWAEQFIAYLQQTASPEAPTIPVGQLFWRGDRGDWAAHQGEGPIRYMTNYVSRQVDAKMHLLEPKMFLPVVFLLRATGWRISDIMTLKHDTCLVHDEAGWMLNGDIPKVKKKDHRVPITKQVAEMIMNQRALVQVPSVAIHNPLKFLFPAPKGSGRMGQSLPYQGILAALKQFVIVNNIRDEQGELFCLATHTFRHTKAVEMINSGDYTLTEIQHWMGHSSPEMTLRYAKIKDTTMRTKFERTMAHGVVRIGSDGTTKMVGESDLEADREINWAAVREDLDAVALPDGICLKPEDTKCRAQYSPCFTCPNFATTPDFLPHFQERYERTLIQIDLGRSRGQGHWVEKNEMILKPIKTIMDELEKNEIHHAAGKAFREYTEEELRKREEEKDAAEVTDAKEKQPPKGKEAAIDGEQRAA